MGAVAAEMSDIRDVEIIEYSPHEMDQLKHEGLLRLFQDTTNDLWEVLELPRLMTSERETLDEARAIVLRLRHLEEEK